MSALTFGHHELLFRLSPTCSRSENHVTLADVSDICGALARINSGGCIVKHRFKPLFDRHQIAEVRGLLEALCQIFPDGWGFPSEELVDEIASGDANHHTILSEFRSAFREEQASAEQIEALAKLAELSISLPDTLENAWMTCFFEHRQMRGALWSALSTEAKTYLKTH